MSTRRRSIFRRRSTGNGAGADASPGEAPVPAPDRPRVLWPAYPPRGYLGQLSDDFQRALSDERSFIDRDDCEFYHSTELAGGEVVAGAWDLRGREHEYVGGVELAGRRVLELGPATGGLTFWMESQGAEVVCFEAGYDVSVDLLPIPGSDQREFRRTVMRSLGAVQNSWWFVHRDHGSRARMAYGDIYALPGDLGGFDVSLFGAILLHLRDPFSALAQAANRTNEQIVVTDVVPDDIDDLEQNVMRIDPLGHPEWLSNWWSISPGAVVAMLTRLGFGRSSITYHTQKHHIGHRLDEPEVEMRMFTVVADRDQGSAQPGA